MIAVRAVFEKRRRAKYISHLDLMRCMQRTFKRAGVPIWFTEGFNPHAYLMFPLALSLGCESGCECMDFRLDGDMPMEEAMARLNGVLPDGLKLLSVAAPVHKHTDIRSADYAVTLTADDASALRSAWEAFFSQETLLTEKKTKRGITTVDLKASVELRGVSEAEGGIRLEMRLPAGTSVNLNPTLLTAMFEAYCKGHIPQMKLGFPRIERLAILCADGTPFT